MGRRLRRVAFRTVRPDDRPPGPDDVVLGIDVGTTNTKAALVRLGPGPADPVEELAVAAVPTPADAWDLLAAVRDVVGEVLARRPGRPPAAVGVASMAETGVPLDGGCEPLTPLLRWDGHRAGGQAATLDRTYGREALFAATGVRVSAKVPLATLLWLTDRGVRPHRWAGAADLVALALTGRLVTDHTLAGRTMAYRATREGPLPTSFDADLLAAVGLAPDVMPEVAAPDAVGGYVGESGGRGVAGSLADGLVPRGTPVVVAGHDHAVGTWAAGVRRPGRRADSLGTAEAVLTVLDRAPDASRVARAGMSWVRTVAGTHHALLAGSSSAGAMLGWLEQRLAVPLHDALAAATGPDVGAAGLVVLPYLAGRQTPAPDPDARVAVVAGGAPLTEAQVRSLGAEDPGRLARAVLDGVSLQARWMLEEQATLGSVRPAGPVVVLGAAARTVPGWAAAKHRVSPDALAWVGADEPVAVGAAVLAAARAGLLGDPATALVTAPAMPSVTEGPATEPHADPARLLRDFVRAATATRPGRDAAARA